MDKGWSQRAQRAASCLTSALHLGQLGMASTWTGARNDTHLPPRVHGPASPCASCPLGIRDLPGPTRRSQPSRRGRPCPTPFLLALAAGDRTNRPQGVNAGSRLYSDAAARHAINQVDADHQRTSPVDGYPGPKGPRAPTTRTKAPSPSEIPTGPQRNAASRGRSSSIWFRQPYSQRSGCP